MKTQKNTSTSGKLHSCRFILAALAAMTGAALHAAVPEISGVTMAQASDRLVTIAYTLADAPAVVTVDVQTNVTGDVWSSIGGEAVWNAMGDVWKRVETGNHTITWRPDHSWPDHKIADGGARAVVTAWALDNTPDYMVVDLAATNTVRYYPAVDFLPGSELGQTGTVTNNPAYKTSQLLMRKIMARGVEWTMGSASGETQRNATRETAHKVTLANNYYIGVFEITQSQWKNIATNSTTTIHFSVEGAMRPMERVCYNEIRNAANTTTANTSYDWPNDPNPLSFLGLLRSKTGLDFDLPTEAQWEFAARAGHGSGYWNDGAAVMNADTDADLAKLGRYKGDNPGGTSTTATLAPSEGGTAIVGSYTPSDWGLYDMHGNMWELCLDWYEDNLTAHGGAVNINPATPTQTLSGASGTTRVMRGGSWGNAAGSCRPAYRSYNTPSSRNTNDGFYAGFRVLCSAGLR